MNFVVLCLFCFYGFNLTSGFSMGSVGPKDVPKMLRLLSVQERSLDLNGLSALPNQ